MAKDINEALLEIQTEGIEGVSKDAQNPHFKNTYITLGKLLEKVKPVLSSKGVMLVQIPVETLQGTPGLETMLYHPESNTRITGTSPLMLEKDNPQGLGSAITYLRRYSLMSILGLVADDDDDGEKASPRKAKVPPSVEVVNAELDASTKPLF